MVKLTPQDYKIMPWKNGRGQTAEILVARPTEAFSHDFTWRLSAATVDRSGPFSLYPGFDRCLAVWRGGGLNLNGDRVEPFTVVRFAGELAVDCVPIGPSVKDLGLIFLRGDIEAQMRVLRIAPSEFMDLRNENSGRATDILFCATGEVRTSTEDFQFTLTAESCLHWDRGQVVTLTVAPELPAECVLFHIQIKKASES